MNLTQMRARVRQDLHDEDASNYRWTDTELNRHIDHALREVSLAVPLQAKATLVTTAGSRELSVAALTGNIMIEAVEYPVGKYPPLYVSFSRWVDTVTLLIEQIPAGGESVNIYYGKLHTLDAASSTIPEYLEDLLATGAEAYAALEWANFAVNRVNLGGEDTWRSYLSWGQDRLAAFLKGLAKYGRKNTVRVRQLYRPAQSPSSQSTDWGL